MDSFGGLDNFWDLSQHPSTFPTLPEDDFLALLQKQFPGSNPFDLTPPDGIDPISINPLPISNPTPPSTDSSPSPPSTNQEPVMSRRHSGVFSSSSPVTPDGNDDPSLKRKASDEAMADEPTHKNAHTDAATKKSAGAAATAAANAASRRKSGNPHQDESRILKRKEQNRAAQRAFRERKEKHVKDLEEKVAALEAKNQQAESENGNLRDLLSRLQSENMALKQAAFTFTMPKPNTAAQTFQQPPSNGFFSTPGASTSQIQQQPQQSNSQYDTNFGSLIPFDPASLNMLDEPSDMNVDYNFSPQNGVSPYKTIASNPMYMTFAEPSPYDLAPSPMQPMMPSPPLTDTQSTPMTTFEWNSSSTANSPPTSGIDSLDQLFGGFNGAQSPVDFSALLRSSPSSVSPVSLTGLRSTSASSSNSPASTNSAAGSPVSNASSHTSYPGSSSGEPKTREECAARIAAEGQSPFVQQHTPPQLPHTSAAFFSTSTAGSPAQSSPTIANGESCPKMTREALLAQIKQGAEDSVGPNGGFVRKTSDGNNSMIMCKGSSFPKTEKSERNIEVLTAWRSIMQNPQFKNVDINELCSEFTKKARCDGTKVVLEPEGVSDILETLSSKRA